MHIKCTYDFTHLFLARDALWEGDEVELVGWGNGPGWLVSQSFWVFQVGGEGQSQQRDRVEEVAFSCCLITAVWEVLCTWRSPARQTLWHRRSLSARRLSSSGPPEPCACEREQETESRWGEKFRPKNRWSSILTWWMALMLKPQRDELPNDKTKSCACSPVETS